MAKVKLNAARLSDTDLIQLCTNIKTAMTGNATFTTPTPTLASFGTLLTSAQTALTTSENAQITSKQATAAKDVAQLANYVNLTAAGDETKILSAGMDVQSTRTPAGVPAQVMNLFGTYGDSEGELDFQWDSISGEKSYEMQMSPDPITSTSWVSKGSVTKSKIAVTGLTSSTRMWARVRAISAGGTGAWSDPAVKVVP